MFFCLSRSKESACNCYFKVNVVKLQSDLNRNRSLTRKYIKIKSRDVCYISALNSMLHDVQLSENKT